MKSIQSKKKLYLTILILIIIIILITAIYRYKTGQSEKIDYSSYTGTYATAAQISSDCRYICIGEPKKNNTIPYVVYQQNKPKSVSSGISTVRKNGIQLQFGGKSYTLQLSDHTATLRASGFSTDIDKIDNTPSFINNEKASDTFDKMTE